MELSINTNKREELVDITSLVEKNIDIKNGILHIFIPHATAGITINENADPNLPEDITDFLNKLVKKGIWRHDKIDNNADAHIKASLIGNSVLIPVRDNKMQLGTWQNIFLCEFDGPRKRKIILSFIPVE
jgi:secondary thiamine-phosphate synthase enzyme